MAFGFLQATSAVPANGTTTNLAYTGAVTVNSTLVCAVRVGSATASSPSFSDNINGAWPAGNVITQAETTGGDILFIGYYNGTGAGTPTVTASWTTSASITILVAEYGGSGIPMLVDQKATTQFTVGGTAVNTPSVTTQYSAEILLAILLSSDVETPTSNVAGSSPSSGWTNRINANSGKLVLDDVVVSTTGTYNEHWTLSATTTDATAIVTLAAAVAPTLQQSRHPFHLLGPLAFDFQPQKDAFQTPDTLLWQTIIMM